MTAQSFSSPAPEPHLRGLSLARLAGVDAGLAEGITIDRVLANEGVSSEVWRRAEPGWRARLDEDADEEGPLTAAYDARLATAQARYGRPLPPIDDDLRAWLDFVRRFAEASEPIALLAELRLRPTDLVRAHRRWSSAFEVNAALREQAEILLGEPPGPMPKLEPGESVLRSPPPEGAHEEVTAPKHEEDEDEDDEDDEEDEDEEDEDDDHDEEPPLWMPLAGWPTATPKEIVTSAPIAHAASAIPAPPKPPPS